MQKTLTISSESASAARTESRGDRRLLIDGRLLETARTFPSINPATGEVLGYAPDATVSDAEAAVAAARRAFDATEWSTNAELRVRCLEQFHQALIDHHDELAELTVAEVGATPALIAGAQLDQPIEIVRYYADLLKDLFDDRGSRQHREPGHAAPPLGGTGSRRGGGRHHRLQLSEPIGVGDSCAAPIETKIAIRSAKLTLVVMSSEVETSRTFSENIQRFLGSARNDRN